MSTKHLLTVFAAALVGLPGAFADEPVRGFETDSIVLYQPDSVLRERLPDVKDLAGYIKRLQGVCEKFFSGAETPETLHVVVALKPGKRSRVWLISSAPSPVNAKRDSLRALLEAETPIEVLNGPVAFAIAAKIAGGSGDLPRTDGADEPPVPREWKEAARGHEKPLVVPDGFLELVWPDKK
jgi:hypothetical protein